METVERRFTPLTLAAIFVAVSATTALNYALLPGQSMLDSRRVIQRRIVEHTAVPPDRYRLFVPAITEAPIAMLSRRMPREQAFDATFAVFYVLAMATLLWSLFIYLRHWFSDEQALVGVLFVSCTLALTTRQHEYAPYSFLEPTFLTLALLCMLREKRVLLGAVVAVATLNRETGVFIVLLYVATHPLTKRHLATAAVYGAIWAVVFLAVRFFAGFAWPHWTLERIFWANLSQPMLSVFNIAALLGVFWWFAVAGFSRAPPFVRRTALVVPPYLAVVAVWGIWWEVRLLLPMLPILVPMALSALFHPKMDSRSTPLLSLA